MLIVGEVVCDVCGIVLEEDVAVSAAATEDVLIGLWTLIRVGRRWQTLYR